MNDNEHAIGSGIGAGSHELRDEMDSRTPPVLIPPPPPRPFEDTPIEELRFSDVNTLATLRQCNVRTVRDIEELGCTGTRAFGLLPGDIKALRLGLGGSGVGLPCFVPITRYCLGHDTIGGLQDGQKQFYPEKVEDISRSLTPSEKGRIELIEASRRMQEKNLSNRLTRVADALSGRELPPGFSTEDETPELPPADAMPLRLPAAAATPISYEQPWVCPEHKKTNWACRYCVAQAIVEGPLEPKLIAELIDNSETAPFVAVVDVDAAVADFDKAGMPKVEIYACVARFTRRLAREE